MLVQQHAVDEQGHLSGACLDVADSTGWRLDAARRERGLS
jgi:hypothetical protein